MNAQPPEVKAVFDRALEIDDPAERRAYLDRIGDEFPKVRTRLEEIAARPRAGRQLSSGCHDG